MAKKTINKNKKPDKIERIRTVLTLNVWKDEVKTRSEGLIDNRILTLKGINEGGFEISLTIKGPKSTHPFKFVDKAMVVGGLGSFEIIVNQDRTPHQTEITRYTQRLEYDPKNDAIIEKEIDEFKGKSIQQILDEVNDE